MSFCTPNPSFPVMWLTTEEVEAVLLVLALFVHQRRAKPLSPMTAAVDTSLLLLQSLPGIWHLSDWDRYPLSSKERVGILKRGKGPNRRERHKEHQSDSYTSPAAKWRKRRNAMARSSMKHSSMNGSKSTWKRPCRYPPWRPEVCDPTPYALHSACKIRTGGRYY